MPTRRSCMAAASTTSRKPTRPPSPASRARHPQNGIGLIDARGTYVADDDVLGERQAGRSSRSPRQTLLVRNQAHPRRPLRSPVYCEGLDSSPGILLREVSDSNLVANNDVTWSGDGFFLSGSRSTSASRRRRGASGTMPPPPYHNAFRSTFSPSNVYLEARPTAPTTASRSATPATVRGISLSGSRSVGIAIEHGSANRLQSNMVIEEKTASCSSFAIRRPGQPRLHRGRQHHRGGSAAGAPSGRPRPGQRRIEHSGPGAGGRLDGARRAGDEQRSSGPAVTPSSPHR